MCIGTDESSFSLLLELAATNNVESFKETIEQDPATVDLAGLWFSRKIGTTQMTLHPRTPLMVAALYGSLDVLRLILLTSTAPIDRSFSPDLATALHFAAASGTPTAAAAVRILLSAGADPDALDASGRRPADVIAAPHDPIILDQLSSSSSPPLSSSPDSSSPSPTTTKKEYPIDPSLPDIKSSIFMTDEFRMYSFKIRPCSRNFSHDWTECPFVHPGENARRRDPRKHNYSCVPCPDFRKEACSRGDACDYAHGVFESWLHPAQYRTKLCKDGESCNRRVCFFAHTNEELRTLYLPTGSVAVSSPRTARVLEMAMMSLLPGSPSGSMSLGHFAAPRSPGGNMASGTIMGWPQPNVPMLHLPASNLQSSRLRSSFNARDLSANEFTSMLDPDAHYLNDNCYSPSQARMTPFCGYGNQNHLVRSKALQPSNLEDLFSAEVSSPLYNPADQGSLFSPLHKEVLFNQLHHHQQQQGLLSPIKTNMFSPRAMDPHQHASLMQASLGFSGRVSPRNIEQLAALAQREKLQQQLMQGESSRDISLGNVTPMQGLRSQWSSPTGKVDWGFNGEELDPDGPKRSSQFGDWNQPMVSTPERVGELAGGGFAPGADSPVKGNIILDNWLDQMQFDQALDL